MTERCSHKQSKEKNSSERGAIIVEATASLTIFMFAIYTVLSVIQICYAQERIAIAMNSATKQMAQCSHLIRATGIDKIVTEDGKSSQLSTEVAKLMEELGQEMKGSAPDKLTGFLINGGKAMEGDSPMQIVLNLIGEGVMDDLMEKNLVTGGCQGMDDFMKKNRISNIKHIGSSVMKDGRKLYMVFKYDISVVKLFNFEKVFHMRHATYMEIW